MHLIILNLIFLLCYAYRIVGETSFIPNGQRAELFELMDNEVPVFRINLPENEFIEFMNAATDMSYFEDVNNDIKNTVMMLNNQNFKEMFPGYNFTENLPELKINDDGYPTLNYTECILNYREFNYFYSHNNNRPLIFNALNKNKCLNFIKVFYILSGLKSTSVSDDLQFYLNIYGEDNTYMKDTNNFSYISRTNNKIIKNIINILNRSNFTELFPGFNFKESLPELPINEDGHPNIDYKKFIDSFKEYYDNDYYNDKNYILFNKLNNNEYLNLIKVFYVLSDMKSLLSYYDNYDLLQYLNDYGKEKVNMDENGNFSYILDPYGTNNIETINTEYPINGINNDNRDNFETMASESPTDSFYNNDWNNSDDSGGSGGSGGSYGFNGSGGSYGFDGSGGSYDTDGSDNYSSDFFQKFFDNYDFNRVREVYNNLKQFKTKNGTMTVEINNQKKTFNKITFSLGGRYSRSSAKPNFNLKIRGGKDLFGRRQFKIRGDAFDSTSLKTKLMSDIHNKLELPSLSANYITLYINDKFMGLYILTDAFKESWIEYVYGEKDTTSLFKCESCDLTFKFKNYINENKESTGEDKRKLYEFLKEMTLAKSEADIESIFDIDQFYKEVALEYLTSSRDHIIVGHNYYLYKNPLNNKWIYLIYDFDLTFEAYDYPFYEYLEDNIFGKLISSNPTRFNEILKDIVIKVFNPATLFSRIDEIKSFIRPYVKIDRTPDANNKYPGRINKLGRIIYSMEDWDASTEFDIDREGLKYFILNKYRIVCEEFNIECDPNYLNEDEDDYISTTLENIETSYPTITESTSIFATTTSVPTIETLMNENTSSTIEKNIPISTVLTTSSLSTSTFTPTSEASPSLKCFSELIGYPCCSSEVTTIYAQDKYGDWSYDFNKKEWCGLTKYDDLSYPVESENCWSEELGYPCCIGCGVYETDSDGSWGYESNQWCGIIPSRC